ncbi:MAG: hypothetical protein K2F84_05270, partial [Bacteroidales bacterium]|nr:hypothetical protein [Bacteroidales bacterium]
EITERPHAVRHLPDTRIRSVRNAQLDIVLDIETTDGVNIDFRTYNDDFGIRPQCVYTQPDYAQDKRNEPDSIEEGAPVFFH